MIEGHASPCSKGAIDRGSEDGSCAEAAKPWVLAASILGSSMAFIVGSVVNVALPAIQEGLSATTAEMQWVLNAYLLFLGSLILVGGSTGDRYGRRRIFSIGIVVFTLASILSGFARTAPELILARSIQGVGGALLVPASLAMLSASFDKKERGRAIGTWAGFSALTTALGPLVGGWLVDAGSWRAVFFVVVPFALAALAITLWRVPESRAPGGAAIDWRGATLATAGLGAATYGLISAGSSGFSAPRVVLALGGGLGLLALFLFSQARSRDPMIPLGLFRSASFTGANLVTLALYFALSGALFFLPFNLVQVQGYSATAAGAAFLPFTLLMAGLSRWAGGLADRYGARLPLVAGPLVVGIGFVLLALPDGRGGSYWATFFPGMLVLGLGMTVSVAPLTTVVINAVPDAQAGVASGVNNAAARVAGLLAIALFGVVALGVFTGTLEGELERVQASEPAKAAVVAAREDLAAIRVPTDVDEAARRALRGAIDASFIKSFQWVMGIAAVLAAVSAFLAFFWIEPEPGAKRSS